MKRLLIIGIVLVSLWALFNTQNLKDSSEETPKETVEKSVEVDAEKANLQAKQEELRERAQRRKIMLANYSRPRLDSIVAAPPDGQKKSAVIGDPQFLLDWVVAGFGKCGTSTMMHWLANHPEVQSFREEIWELMQRANPEDTVHLNRRVQRQRDRNATAQRINKCELHGGTILHSCHRSAI